MRKLPRHHRNPLLKHFDYGRYKQFYASDTLTLTPLDHMKYHGMLKCSPEYNDLTCSLVEQLNESHIDVDTLDDVWNQFVGNYPQLEIRNYLQQL